jgi:hypothetical protein
MKSPNVDWTKLILGAALILGLTLRFVPTLMAEFPLNDGGMFLDMIRDLRVSQYHLPATTSYNFSDIPYAYPPLGFYLARLLTDLGFSEIRALQFLPALASSAAIYGMYLFASALAQSRKLGAVSALIYALAPRSYTWLVMGGGLTRALGFGLILFIGWAVYRLFQEGLSRWLVLAILFSTLTVLSHPEATVHAVALCLGLWFFFGRTLRAARQAILVAVGTILFSAPWWGTLLARHGLAPFLSVLNTGMHGASPWSTFGRVIFPNDSLLPIFSVLFVAALAWGVWRRQYFLLVFSIMPVIIEPRSALNVMVIPLSILLAGLWFDLGEYVLSRSASSRSVASRNLNLAFFALALYLFAESYLFGFRLVNASLTKEDRLAMNWMRENTPVESRFVLWTGVSALELDAFQEWFPTLAERRSLTTFQGTEWTLGPEFFPWFRELKNLQACEDVDCVQAWVTRNDLSFEYLVVKKKNAAPELLSSLATDGRFQKIYEDEMVAVFAPN